MPGLGEKEQEYTSYEEGAYEVKFGEWFPTDDDGEPTLLVQQRWGEDIPVIRYRTVYLGETGEEQGPPGSIDPVTELPLFVEAFGGDSSRLPKVTMANVAQVLKLAAELMDGSTTVYVNDRGWIRGVEGMSVPEGPQLLAWGRVTSKNDAGQPSWVETEKTYGPVVFGRLKIATGQWEGVEVPFALSYDLEVDPERLVPCLRRLVDRRTGKSRLTASSQRAKLMIESYFGPIKTFPVEEIEDIYNIVPKMAELFEGSGKVGQGYINEKGQVDLNKLMPLPEGVEVKGTTKQAALEGMPEAEVPKKSPPDSSDLVAAQNALRQVITKETKDFEGDEAEAWEDIGEWKLTVDGKSWAGTHLAPIVEELGVGKFFAEYDVGTIKAILEALGYDTLAAGIGAEGEEAEDF